MILVAGATGMVGGEACRLLRREGRAVRAMVRPTSRPEKVAGLRALGCEIVAADLRQRATLSAACAGAEAVVSTVSAMPFAWDPPGNTVETVDRDGQRRLVDAAAAAGVRSYTLVTFSGNIDRPFPLRDAKRTAEAHLRGSGIPHIILRPSFFMEVWLSPAVGFDAAAGRATVYGDGENPISWISSADVARFAAAAVGAAPAREGITLEIGGPESLGPLAVVRLFEQLGGQKFEIQHVPVAALEAQLAAAPDDMQRSFAALMLAYAAGDAVPMAGVLERFPMRLTRVAEFARRALAPVGAAAVG